MKYPFPRNQKVTVNFGFWEGLMARLFGQKFDESSGQWQIICYWYKGKLYLTHYGTF